MTLAELRSADLAVQVDTERGVLRGLSDPRDPAGLNYLGSEPPVGPSTAGLSTGDVVCQVWDGGGWRPESTARSADTRTVEAGQPGLVRVVYGGGSATPGGLRRLSLTQTFTLNDNHLRWTLSLCCRYEQKVEIGELAVPLVANTDVAGIFAGLPPAARAGGEPQRRWHTERVQQYLHISGHGSYVLLQRPSGTGRIASLIPLGDTPLEAAYQIDPQQGSQWSDVFEGPYLLALHSRAARETRGWLATTQRQNRWFHGSTSLVLGPGEERTFGFELALLGGVDELHQQLIDAGQAAVEAAPGYAVGLGHSIRLAISGPAAPRLVPEADGITISEGPAAEDGARRYTLAFGSAGQKPVLVRYGPGRWTRILCYVTPAPSSLLRARARFIASEQLYRNPADPFGRHHAFLPYDDQLEQVFADSGEAWQVGGSDEYGLPIAMFLAACNVRAPSPEQVRALETYIDDFLLGKLQDPVTLDIRRGMVHDAPLPSRRPHEWTEAQSRDVRRFNNYPLAANIYHAMYQVAREHALTRSRTAADYLALAWRTAVRGFEVGELTSAGAPAGAGLFSLLEDLDGADQEGFAALDACLRGFAALVADDPYPYGSELYIDQTAHSQVYAALARYGPRAGLDPCLRVTRTLRWGFQPSWFRYGCDQRGSVCCWYGTAQNSEVLLDAFAATGDRRLLRLGAAGLSSFLASVRASGAARGWFTWWPDRTGFDGRSLDTDLGLYGYLRAAAAYAITEPGFGLVGYLGQAARRPDGSIEVTPDNGVDDRVHFCDAGLSVRSDGRIRRAALAADASLLTLELERTSLARDQVSVRVDGRSVAGVAGSGVAGGAGARVAGRVVTIPGVPHGEPAEIGISLAR